MQIIANYITVKQNNFEIKDILFSLKDNENLVITGPSGSGKTSLAKAFCGQLFITGDLKIVYNKENNLLAKAVYVEQRYSIKNRSNTIDGYYQQRYNSSDNEDSYTVLEELKFILDDEQRVDFLLNELSIAYLKNKPLLQLSSGEHKRFQLIKALLNPAQLMILDEPFIGLDVASRKKLNDILSNVSEKGTKFIIIAGAHHHFPDCVTHVLELENGRQKTFIKKENFVATHQAATYFFDSSSLPLQHNNWNFENAILIKNATVKYGERTILNNINWQVKRGERWLLKGKNGAGKSTLMSLVSGDNPQAYANEIYLFDKRRGSGESIWDIKKNIGFVSPELYAFFDKNISCFDTVASGYFDTIGLYKKLSQEQINHINDWMKALNVADLAQKRLANVSSGMQRLFLLIRAFIKNPPLLIFDEPCQGLDEFQTEAFVKLVDDICERTDTSVVYISHYENEIPNCVTQVLELENGNQKIYFFNKKHSTQLTQ
ncbi:MAG: ATP-binding cassette domain-containing protein [Arachidicoccus sp.]|nr:ATP-binding cassette domain-containing protein [Arachidicoccus sp.]